ncbi:hypothetical protein Lesp02_70320 [Lentzea sp. NBRC 105346]|uniref:hypothetical protein n=1 Tax=Lentzea sp. NBRC 105346 TaxID=3032205 RepID=UPI0024A3C7F5|nr:hypothetical protein [Lentzea sp. NBRC 105346]GLZ34845.1 hypothetical protein Lesp02_70320 [Lentzea sp. NBRC 105346]
MTAPKDEFAESLIPAAPLVPPYAAPKNPDPYDSDIEPVVGGRVRVNVSGWAYWSVWLDVESYVEWMGDTNTALQPSECIAVARRLIVAAVVCWWKRLPDQLRGRLRSMKEMRRG